MQFHIAVARSIETVFELISDLSGYKAWLPSSELFTEVVDISDYPVKVGTTYGDKGATTTMRGEVVAMEPPRIIAFRQTTHIERAFLSGELTISIRYQLEAIGGGETQITRELHMHTTGLLTVARPLLIMAIRKENERILQSMKIYLESRVG